MQFGFTSGARIWRKAALLFVASGVVASAGCGPKPLAVLNGETLTEQQFTNLCENHTPAGQSQLPVGHQVLAKWIQDSLIAQEARRLKIYPTQQELQARMSFFDKQAQLQGKTLQQVLEEPHITLDEFKQVQLENLIQENVVCQGVTVSDAELRDYFDKQKPRMMQPAQVEMSQITLDSEEQVKKAQDDLGSGDFAVVAQTRSKDPFAAQGGRIPMSLPKQAPPGGPIDQKALDAAFKLKPGQMSEPIKLSSGHWVIVRLEKKIETKEPKFEDFQEIFRSQLRRQKAQAQGMQKVQDRINQLTNEATLVINRPKYKYIEADLKKRAAGPAVGSGEMPPAPPQ